MEHKSGSKTTELWFSVGVFVLMFVASAVMLWFAKITNAQWIDLCKWIGVGLPGLFGLSRGAIKTVSALKAPPQ